MPKYKYTMIYFDDTIGEIDDVIENSGKIHFVDTSKNCHLCSVSSNDYDSLLRQAENLKRRFWIGLFKDAEVLLRHVIPSGE